jgi:hypothetical protein
MPMAAHNPFYPSSTARHGAADAIQIRALGLDPLAWLPPAPLPDEELARSGNTAPAPAETSGGQPLAADGPSSPDGNRQDSLFYLLAEGSEPLLM